MGCVLRHFGHRVAVLLYLDNKTLPLLCCILLRAVVLLGGPHLHGREGRCEH